MAEENGANLESGLPQRNVRKDFIGPYPLKSRPEKKIGGRSAVGVVETNEGDAVAKLATLNPEDGEDLRYEFSLNRKVSEAWPRGVNSVTKALDYLTITRQTPSGETEEVPVLLTKLIPGMKTLNDNLVEYFEKHQQRLGVQGAINRLYSVALGVDAMKTAGVVHRDIKPSNIFMHHNIGILGDFGYAVEVGFQESGDNIHGTGGFIAPEHARNEKLGNRTNIWGLGAVTFYTVTGELLMDVNSLENTLLFHDKDIYDAYIRSRIEKLSPAVQEVFWKAVAFDPGERYDSGSEFMIALDRANKETHIKAHYDFVKLIEGRHTSQQASVPRSTSSPYEGAFPAEVSPDEQETELLDEDGGILFDAKPLIGARRANALYGVDSPIMGIVDIRGKTYARWAIIKDPQVEGEGKQPLLQIVQLGKPNSGEKPKGGVYLWPGQHSVLIEDAREPKLPKFSVRVDEKKRVIQVHSTRPDLVKTLASEEANPSLVEQGT